jgi:probable F420-dependent oxidoreductase
MRLGLSTPIVVQIPGVASAWEATAGPEELAEIAASADALGFDHLTCSEHIGVPISAGAGRGTTYWDPLATLSFIAAHTSRIRLATSVLVAAYHHPLAVAKQYGTLDVLSGGRVVLGVGVGSLAEEFALLGARWEDRGAVTDAFIDELHRVWGRPEADGMIIEPHGTSMRVPVWVGGQGARSLRRAISHGDGWVPFGLRPAQLGEMLESVDLPSGFEVVLSPGRPLDPHGDPDGTALRLVALRDAGATVVTCAITADSPAHYCDQLAGLAQLAADIPPRKDT